MLLDAPPRSCASSASRAQLRRLWQNRSTDQARLEEVNQMKNVVRFLMPIAIAVVLGPLTAGLIICLLAFSTYFFDPSGGMPIADLFRMFGIYIMFAYLGGGPIALLAGLLVSIWMIWRPPGFVVATVAAITAIGLCRLADEIGMFSPIGGPLVSNNFALMLVLAIIAASVCWLLTRSFVRTT
jgi:hypothetical protein